MSEPFVGQIQPFGFNFAPRGWAKCDGQLLPISSNSALFSLLGTTYGGDGRTTFGLPDLRGRVPMHAGSGPGLSTRQIGQKSGAENVTLTESQMPAHNHGGTVEVTGTVQCNPGDGNADSPAGNTIAKVARTNQFISAGPSSPMHDNTVTASGNFNTSNAGGSQPHNNMQPFLVVNYCIALVGIFPSRD
jgi:microcystin-dependent protein